MGGKTVEASFQASPQRFAARNRAVAELGYAILHTDSASLIVSFNTGRSMKSWAGQDLSTSVVPTNDCTRVIVGGSLAKGGNPFGSSQVGAWEEKSALSKKFLDTVTRILPSITEPQATTQPSAPSSMADELAKLRELVGQGVISEAEFAQAKQRLLG